MPARADRWIAVRLVIVVAVLAASVFAGALPASAQVKLIFDKHPGIDFNRYVDGQDLFGRPQQLLARRLDGAR